MDIVHISLANTTTTQVSASSGQRGEFWLKETIHNLCTRQEGGGDTEMWLMK